MIKKNEDVEKSRKAGSKLFKTQKNSNSEASANTENDQLNT